MVLADTPANPPARKACKGVIRLSFAVLILQLAMQPMPLVAKGGHVELRMRTHTLLLVVRAENLKINPLFVSHGGNYGKGHRKDSH